ncbi:hypothetical protein C8Q74DRAFT_1363380 [Fomes fomentarius]|nr:hypothetical protein C8Q74DRAFT_1363380 [Fomes fomentarius]
MSARGITHIARLTLFSGPHCSLCDIAKAELAKVRQQRQFELETVNIQGEGQERWKKKYVYWIPALHIEGKEVAKGRWDAQTSPLYYRVHEDVLGEDTAEEDSPDVPRCFNCGEPDHVVSACPQPFDSALVALSRQMFNFFRGGSGGPSQRFHEAAEWRTERLRWLDRFEPGEIKGSLLRDALGLEEGDVGERVEWLRKMAYWGYPPGWVGSHDPRENVWERIADAAEDSEDECEFTIHGDDGEERCILPGAIGSRSPQIDEDELSEAAPARFARWAKYPDTFFLYSMLPVYTGWRFPSPGAERRSPPVARVSSTYTADRQALWQTILESSTSPVLRTPSVPPWRQPSAFGYDWTVYPPYPPGTPPPPPSIPPPLPDGPVT